MVNKKYILLLLKQFHKNSRSKTLGFRKVNHSLEMQNDALVHREGLTFTARGLTLDVRI